MPKYDYNEMFEDGIGRSRRMGAKEKADTLITFFLILALGLAGGIIIDSITHNGF